MVLEHVWCAKLLQLHMSNASAHWNFTAVDHQTLRVTTIVHDVPSDEEFPVDHV